MPDRLAVPCDKGCPLWESGSWAWSFGGAAHEGERADSECRRVKRCRRPVRPVTPKQGDVCRRVAADEPRRNGLTAREGDGDLAFFRQRLVGGDDQAGPPYETARS